MDVSSGPDGRAGGVVKLPVVRRWILLSDLHVEPRPNIYGG